LFESRFPLILVVEDPYLTFFYDVIPVAGVAFSDHNVSRFAVDHVKGVREDAFMFWI